MPQITLQTRIDDPSGVLDAFTELMNRVERRIHAELLSGRNWTGDLAVSLYSEFGISAKQFARLTIGADGLFDLELRLPEALKAFATKTIRFSGRDIYLVSFGGLKFSHYSYELAASLTRGIPVAVRFHRDGTGWRVMPTFKVEIPEAKVDYSSGAIGVDLNAGFVSIARADKHGNVVEAFDILMVTYGKSQDQSRDVIRKVAKQVVEYVAKHDLPIVSERLDFARKKRGLTDGHDARYARMLSSFVYSSFDAALSTAVARSAFLHRRVNPAYTSIIGRVKFARRYGLSTHQSAALAIARRAMQLGERPPRSFKESRSVGVSLDDAHHVTLELPVRKDPGAQDAGTRHVWSDWNEVVKALRDAHAARRPSRRRKRPRPVMGRNDLHSMVCRSRRAVPEQLHPVAGSSGRSCAATVKITVQ